jgi:hypothetical protein
MKISINEELNYMKYLFGYQKGRVISEQYKPQLNPDGCEKGYYRDCKTNQCVVIPANTKITYSQKTYDFMVKTYAKIKQYNEAYEKSINKFYTDYWNYYLNVEKRQLSFTNPITKLKIYSPKYHSFLDFNDFKKKIDKGNFANIANISINKPVFDWIKNITKKYNPNYYNLLKKTRKFALNTNLDRILELDVDKYDFYRYNVSREEVIKKLIIDDNNVSVLLLGRKWFFSDEYKLLNPLIDKMYDLDLNLYDDSFIITFHFKKPPSVILGCESTNIIKKTEPIITEPIEDPKQPIKDPEPPIGPPPPPIEDPKPPIKEPDPIKDPEPTVNPNYPEYSLQYKKKKYLDVKLPKNKVKSVFDRGVLNTPGRFKISEKDPKEIARYVKYYEGYDDNEGNHIPGEIEKAQQQNRQIRFLDPVSDEDELAQQGYKEEYAEYKKIK